MSKIEQRSNPSGDWTELWVDGELRFEGHSISDHEWRTLLIELGHEVTSDESLSDWEE